MSDFHWQGGWFFDRLDDGSVHVEKRVPVQERVRVPLRDEDRVHGLLATRGHRSDPVKVLDDKEPVNGPYIVVESFTVPGIEWCSIVSSMTPDGGISTTHQKVHELHFGARE